MEIPNIKNLKQGQFSRKFFEKHYPEFFNYLLDKYKGVSWKKFSELPYLYFHNMDDVPKCPVCGKYVSFINYSKGYRTYCCMKCLHKDPKMEEKIKQSFIEKYGVENAFQNKDVQEKVKQTYLERYGVDNPSKLKEVREKAKQTMIKKYGVPAASMLDEFKEKAKQTYIKKYGVSSPTKLENVKEKQRQTCLNKYGVKYASSTPEFREKVKQTCLNKYGATTYTQTKEFKEKSKQNCLNKYGVDNIAKLEETTRKKKQTCLNKYGVESNSQTPQFREKYKQTMIKNYGAESYFQSNEYKNKVDEIMNKIYQTKKQRKTFNSSKIEKQFREWLNNNKIDYKYQYKSKEYPFVCDFYFPKNKLYLEIQGYFTHGKHPFNPNDDDDIKEIEKLQNKNYHNKIETWTIRDPMKRQWAKDHDLNWVEVFTSDVDVLIDKVKDVL